jgi:RNase H-fold protein (predicted Holliday junction resolvase)
MPDKVVLAIDPGRNKCGFALVRRDDRGKVHLLWRRICNVEDLESVLTEASSVAEYSMLVVGGGTTSRSLVHRLREAVPSLGILVVDEKDTTMHARERYWEHNPRRGWRRLLPATMQVPPESIDDFAALVIAERVIGDA